MRLSKQSETRSITSFWHIQSIAIISFPKCCLLAMEHHLMDTHASHAWPLQSNSLLLHINTHTQHTQTSQIMSTNTKWLQNMVCCTTSFAWTPTWMHGSCIEGVRRGPSCRVWGLVSSIVILVLLLLWLITNTLRWILVENNNTRFVI